MTAPSPSQALCPVDGCQHMFDLTVTSVADNALADVFGFGVLAAVHRNKQALDHEQAMADHFAEHTMIEFLASLVKANRRVARAESTAEDQHDRAERLARQLHPRAGDLVKGWADEGGSAQGILMTTEEFSAGTAVGDLPTYYAAIRLQPSGQIVVVMRESLRGVEP